MTKVELTYPGVANLTAVDFFGIPFRLRTLSNGGRALGELAYNAPTDAIELSLLAIPGARRALVRTTTGAFARFLSPQLSPTGHPTMGVMAAEVHSTLDVSIWPGGAKATALRGRSSKRNPPFEASRSLPSSRS
jgi:hypothetical protein